MAPLLWIIGLVMAACTRRVPRAPGRLCAGDRLCAAGFLVVVSVLIAAFGVEMLRGDRDGAGRCRRLKPVPLRRLLHVPALSP